MLKHWWTYLFGSCLLHVQLSFETEFERTWGKIIFVRARKHLVNTAGDQGYNSVSCITIVYLRCSMLVYGLLQSPINVTFFHWDFSNNKNHGWNIWTNFQISLSERDLMRLSASFCLIVLKCLVRSDRSVVTSQNKAQDHITTEISQDQPHKPNQTKCHFPDVGMRVHVFLAFVHELRAVCGLGDSRHVGLDEQVAIFLYMCVTSLSIRHVAERFQCSNYTISK